MNSKSFGEVGRLLNYFTFNFMSNKIVNYFLNCHLELLVCFFGYYCFIFPGTIVWPSISKQFALFLKVVFS